MQPWSSWPLTSLAQQHSWILNQPTIITFFRNVKSGSALNWRQTTHFLWSTVTLLAHIHQLVPAEGGAVCLVRPWYVQQTAATWVQDHLLKVISTTAAKVTRTTEDKKKNGSKLKSHSILKFLNYTQKNSRCPWVHNAVRDIAFTVSAIIMVHPKIMTQLMSHDGGKWHHIIIGELRGKCTHIHTKTEI